MIDQTWFFYSKEKYKDLLREAEQNRRIKASRHEAPKHRHQRFVYDLKRPVHLWKQLAAAILGH